MADNANMAQLRAQQMAQMAGGKGAPSAEQVEQQRRKQQAEEEQRRIMLNQIVTAEAREKLANIRLVKPERASQVESLILNAASSGQLSGRVSEEQLKDLLLKVTETTQKKTSVTIVRRRRFDDDDDDDDDDW